jgi:large subunit ribosomal protein L28
VEEVPEDLLTTPEEKKTNKKYNIMSKVCQITGRKRMIGNNVAHSKLRTKRDFALNLKTKKFWSEAEQRFITLKVTTKGMRIIEKNGLDATLKEAQKKGYVNLV